MANSTTHLTAGMAAPDFSLPDQDGNLVSLKDFAGKKLVLYFYPQDNTPTCTTQACNLRDNMDMLRAAGYSLLGISPDTPASHRKFIAKHGLNFPLLADEDKTMLAAYGVWAEKSMYGRSYMGVLRTTFLVDAHGILTDVISKVESKRHSEQILG
jgi:thioredoxin-dependent peroxiredoxin